MEFLFEARLPLSVSTTANIRNIDAHFVGYSGVHFSKKRHCTVLGQFAIDDFNVVYLHCVDVEHMNPNS